MTSSSLRGTTPSCTIPSCPWGGALSSYKWGPSTPSPRLLQTAWQLLMDTTTSSSSAQVRDLQTARGAPGQALWPASRSSPCRAPSPRFAWAVSPPPGCRCDWSNPPTQPRRGWKPLRGRAPGPSVSGNRKGHPPPLTPADAGTVLKVISVPKGGRPNAEGLLLEELHVFEVRPSAHPGAAPRQAALIPAPLLSLSLSGLCCRHQHANLLQEGKWPEVSGVERTERCPAPPTPYLPWKLEALGLGIDSAAFVRLCHPRPQCSPLSSWGGIPDQWEVGTGPPSVSAEPLLPPSTSCT